MTIVDGVEIDNITYNSKNIKKAIQQNDLLEDKLHVVMVISNPCQYQSRYRLAKEYVKRMENQEENPNVILYIVELIYGEDQSYMITNADNPRHLQLHTEIPLWHKENLINLGIERLLPQDWKSVAWIDADIEFDSPDWAKHTLKILNGECDIVQLFSHCVDMGPVGETMNVFSSAGYQYHKGAKYKFYGSGRDYWHPGYAWACTRTAYEKMGGLYERAILGSGDNIMFLSLIGHGLKAIHRNSTEEYKKSVKDFQGRVSNLKFGYVPGLIRHYFHGDKKNRQYVERWRILLDYKYDPNEYILRDSKNGVLVPNQEKCPVELLQEIMSYFKGRKEDD